MERNSLTLIKTAIDHALKLVDGARFATFDFDNTVIVNDIAEATLAYVCRNGLLKDQTLIPEVGDDYHQEVFRHYYKLLDEGKTLDAYTFCAQTLAGFASSELDSLVSSVVEYEGQDITETELYGVKIAKGLSPRPQILELMQWLHNKGVKVWVVSASPEPLVARAMEHFGVVANLIGLRNKVEKNVYTKNLQQPMSVLGGKVDCIKIYINQHQKPILAAGDSMNDFPMLDYAEIKVVVDRGNKLAELARTSGWFLL